MATTTITTTTVVAEDGATKTTTTTTSAGPPAKGKLIYFDQIGGRGEPIHILLNMSKVEHEYETFTLADFANPDSDYHKRKAAGEFSKFAVCGGGLPVYQENGKTYFETNAILRMLGARHGYYSTDPETMYQIDVCMEEVEQVFEHCGVAQHSHYVLANINKSMGNGDGPTEEQAAACYS
eukprot:UC4_evm1s523